MPFRSVVEATGPVRNNHSNEWEFVTWTWFGKIYIYIYGCHPTYLEIEKMGGTN